ncbi:MAG: hypothetical protein JO030_02635 [Candidatus Eremiobacteraeota bacterium]|nr:hypothetical protein [Candidatus Eremiobacteraeota bacterium]
MRHLRAILALSISATFAAGCSANNGSAIANAPEGSSVPSVGSNAGMAKAARLFHFRHTPAYPPKPRHRITSADRARALAAGWTPVSSKAAWTNGAGTEILMTDGTVLVQDYCTPNWFSLTPDKTGSYVNGKWTKVAPMSSSYGPLYFASAVLPDGKLIVNGGEYNFCNQDETNLGAIYDPVANTWTPVTGPSGWSEIGDASSVVLPDGTYMLGNCCMSDQALLDESNMTWTQVGNGKHDTNSEEGWTLLRDGNVLTADVFGEPNSEIYNRHTQTWSSAGNLPNNLTQGFEIGPQTMMPNNKVWVAGANQYTAVFDANTKTWYSGPNFPIINGQQEDAADAPSTLLTNGRVMLAVSPGLYSPPAAIVLYNGTTIKQIPAFPNAPNDSSYNVRLLMLPTGEVLEADGSSDVEVYTRGHHVKGIIPPQIASVPTTITHGNTYKISGRYFSGFSQTNFYGDDVQQATNFPLVQITNNGTGHVFYARTHNHSFMGIASHRRVSTMFDVPSGIETGASTLRVIANGVPSAGVSVTIN